MNHLKPVFRTHLSTNGVEQELRRLLSNLAESAKYVSAKIKDSNRARAGSVNAYGEEQLELDLYADTVILERLAQETSFGVLCFISEEQGKVRLVDPRKGTYSVTADPLDGSSLIDVNLSVGSIFGIHGNGVGLASGRDSMVAAMYVTYGPETTLVYSTGNGVHEFVLDHAGNWVVSRQDIRLDEKGKIYSVGGTRSEWPVGHLDFVERLESAHYKLRYSGALVADFNQILLKGGGVFSYPRTKSFPEGKLRLLMELQPLAFLAENAGGMATDGVVPILNKVPNGLEELSPAYLGSRHEVELAKDFLVQESVSDEMDEVEEPPDFVP